jgi:alkanesulfonate monooxygenase SsuD/methylene tetrahydromethanopterin reductase-like flavin-dependent oxidoreductase (luciferase family)
MALEEAINVIRLMWSGDRGVHFEGKFYQLSGVHTGPLPAHPIGIWLGGYKPRMLELVGRMADGWVPSLGGLKPEDMAAANARIDEAAAAAGRKPSTIRRLLNVGAVSADELATLALEHGFDTFLIGEEELQRFAADVGPKVRELIAAGRGSS